MNYSALAIAFDAANDKWNKEHPVVLTMWHGDDKSTIRVKGAPSFAYASESAASFLMEYNKQTNDKECLLYKSGNYTVDGDSCFFSVNKYLYK